MKKLLAIGDSFTYGEELADINNAWPYVLGNRLNYEVINLGKSASGNTRMVRCLIEQNIKDFDLVIIAWSHFDRIELADELGIYETWPGGERKVQRAQGPWRETIIDYISRHHNDDYLYRLYLSYIILAQNHLKANGIPYLMLDTFGNHQDSRRFSQKNKDLVSQIDIQYYVGWPKKSMMEWTHGCSKGPCHHFLEQGHEIVAEKIYNKACTIL